MRPSRDRGSQVEDEIGQSRLRTEPMSELNPDETQPASQQPPQARSANRDASRSRRPFLARFHEAFAYPFRGLGWATILAGALFFWVCKIIAAMSCSGFLLTGLVAGYLASYMFKMIGSSAGGDDAPPDWPDFADLVDDILRPMSRVGGAVVFSFGPLIVAYVLWHDADGGLDPRLLWWLLAFAALYLPMSLLAVTVLDSVGALNPVTVIGGILRVGPAYLLAVGVLLACFWASASLQQTASNYVPYVGSLLAVAVSLYFLMVEMHVLGLLYRCYEQRLGWLK